MKTPFADGDHVKWLKAPGQAGSSESVCIRGFGNKSSQRMV